ncbi:MAG: transketolase family protein [Aliifodinibius sp.]|nr:transketolase family protein [Fodinibius sp.]
MLTKEEYLKKSSRDAYGIALYDLASFDDKIVTVTADVPESVRFTKFRETWPERFFNFGIAEQNMMAAAAGLARTGKTPFVSVYAIFAAMRAIEQLRTDIAYPGLPVRVCVTHSGISLGPAGPTHHSIEDISILRSIANMTVIAPADGVSTAMAMNAIKDYDGPVYMRLSRAVEPTVYSSMQTYQIGKANIIREGKDITIFAYGASVGNALIAAASLAKDGIDVQVVDMAFIKPFDRDLIVESANKTGTLLTVEEQTILGGLGSVVAEVLAEENIDVKFKRLGIPDQYTLAGPYEDLQQYYKLDPEGISQEARKLLE